jgi:riboflavin synthase alpha subunit
VSTGIIQATGGVTAIELLGDHAPGSRVNLDADVLAEYVEQHLDRVVPGRDGGVAP